MLTKSSHFGSKVFFRLALISLKLTRRGNDGFFRKMLSFTSFMKRKNKQVLCSKYLIRKRVPHKIIHVTKKMTQE